MSDFYKLEGDNFTIKIKKIIIWNKRKIKYKYFSEKHNV